jgi:predicted metalloprotease with PDZ domain
MLETRCRLGLGVGGLVLALVLAIPGRASEQPAAINMSVDVDVTDAPRKLLTARLHIPVKPGPLTLHYPKWIPGEHGPSGPITDLVGLKISARGSAIPWRRDAVEMFDFHCDVPDGTDAIDVALGITLPPTASGFSAGASTTAKLGALNWNQVVIYPKGPAARDITCKPSVRVPPGWKVGTALTVIKHQDNVTEFAPVSLETLVDSPALCGVYLREVPLVTVDGRAHSVVIVCDSAAGLEMSPAVKANLDQLVIQAGKLFGARHYQHYKFLLTLSDQVANFGLEHHECSDDRTSENALIDDNIKKGMKATLLPHEFVHSWNGKYRRPADMITPTFQEAQHTKLLWVYEGLTQYLGTVLAARSGLWTPEQFRDNLAIIALWAQNQKGREWRPLEDTTVAAQLLYYARADWGAYRRAVDFYDEGILLWLEVDTLIREKTKGQRSLDDFCQRFHGGSHGPASVKGFTFDQVVADLDAVVSHEWKTHWISRLTSTDKNAPLKGIERGGWKLAFASRPSALQSVREEDDKGIDLTASLGMSLSQDGKVIDVIPGLAAHKAGVGPGMKIIAVNGRRFSEKGLRAAVTTTKTAQDPLALLVENGEYFRNLSVDYHGGDRNAVLERAPGAEDVLAAICQARK